MIEIRVYVRKKKQRATVSTTKIAALFFAVLACACFL